MAVAHLKSDFLSVVLGILLATAGCTSAGPPASPPESAPPASALPAPRPTTAPGAQTIPFDTHEGYFVSNKFEPEAATSFLVIHDRETFDSVFGTAMVMGDKSRRLPPDAFDAKAVIAVIKRGHATWDFTVQQVVDLRDADGTTLIRYTAVETKSGSAQFACPLIVSVPAGIYSNVEFEENGQVVHQIKLDWYEVKQAAGAEAERANEVLAKVYDRLLTALSKPDPDGFDTAKARANLVDSQKAWEEYRKQECYFKAEYPGHGTDAHYSFPLYWTELTEARTAVLREIYAEWVGEK